MTTPLISVHDLTKTCNMGEVAVRALRGVSLNVDAGEFIALTGLIDACSAGRMRSLSGWCGIVRSDVTVAEGG